MPHDANIRFGKMDWLEIGFRLLASEGPSALTIGRLTGEARRTRGSFYHHFEDREDFVREMMVEWRERSTEQAARRMAVVEPLVREMLDEMDRRRVEGFAALVAGARPDVADPQSFALLAYSVIVGCQWLLGQDDPRAEGLKAAGEALFWPEG